MPELPEVETVKETLKHSILKKRIKRVDVRYPNIIEAPSAQEFIDKLKGQEIVDINRRGKWLMFILNNNILVSHLRMEGKFFLKTEVDEINKHEHVIFKFTDGTELRYQDTRKFGRMYLLNKEEAMNVKPLCELGLEPWDENLTASYLQGKYKTKKLPIKTVLLDQTIITGIGNIYADEILFLSKIDPLKACSNLTKAECNRIIQNTREVLEKAIKMGGTTIRSYESSEGVHGRFQHSLLVHNHEGDRCPVCGTTIIKTKVGGRGTYYCGKCQKSK